jgi:hypothetical protein
MKKIEFNFQHCYGIKKLSEELIFSNKTYAIYAPNGVMKTSFAKTLDDYAKDSETKDLAFPERKTVRDILVDDKPIDRSSIFVIESYNKDYKSEKISTLLANKKLKQEYEEIHKEIDKAIADLTKKLKQLSGLTARKDGIEDTISNIFKKKFLDFLLEKEDEIAGSSPLPFHDIKYQIIFNDAVSKFLETSEIRKDIGDYIEKYDELTEKSPYLGKEFKFHHAEAVQKQLVSNNFFKGGHSVNLFNEELKNGEKYSSDEELNSILQSEKKKIFSDEELQGKFDKISNKLSNKELKDFRDYLLENKEILPELADLDSFSKKIWISYLVNQKDLFLDLVKKYKTGQDEIKKLIELARVEKTDWEDVIRIFNARFSHLPFLLKIRNKEDVILKSDVETIEFLFKDDSGEKLFDKKDDLLKILSTGEQRALYILNIIFEVEARKKEGGETLFVIDDIADSFDYKNKYAIVEYLKYMSEINSFYMIILTHNFDFFRTVQSRKISTYSQCLISLKNAEGIKLIQIKGLKNPFIYDWKNNLSDKKKLIASIPFVRNLVEYKEGFDDVDGHYLLLTSVLHSKAKTENILIKDIKEIFEKNLSNISFPSDFLQEPVINVIFSAADECLTADEGVNLENKIVLSIAIRLKAENFMKSKITNEQFLADLDKNSNQTWNLLRAYEEEFNNEKANIEVLRRVNLITPENIHINSFMYEPILDMGDGELRELYKSVKNIGNMTQI